MFDSLKKRLDSFVGGVEAKAKPKISASTKVRAAVTGKARLSEADIEDTLWQLQMDLLQNDVSVEAADHLIESLKNRLLGSEVSSSDIGGQIRSTLRSSLLESVSVGEAIDAVESARQSKKPYKILFLGVNGTGKTTTMAKMAKLFMDGGLSVVFAAGDTFRAGAIEQLTEHAKNLGVKVISHKRGADSAAVIYDAVEHAKARGVDVVLADTAGRMQSKANLMEELKKIVRVSEPDLKLFVGDALAGNDAVEQARAFNDAVGFDAAVLSKMDADAKGGGALSIAYCTRKPIAYVGVGQSYSDLRAFDPEWFVDNILG